MASPNSDPVEAISHAVAGLTPLEGERDQLRITYAGAWDGPLFFTVSFDDAAGEISVVDPGDEFKPLVMAALTGAEAEVAPSRQESRAALGAGALAAVRPLFDQAWSLGQGEPRGTDGYWITADLYSPGRGTHQGRDWCPPASDLLGRLARLVLELATEADPSLELKLD